MRGIQTRLSIKIASVALATGMAIASSAAWADSGPGGGTDDDRLRLEVRLDSTTSPASAHGKWEIRRNRFKASMEGEDMAVSLDVDGLNDVTATIMLNCDPAFMIAGIRIDNLGFFDLNLDSGSLDGVPVCEAGDTVSISTTGGDVLSGNLFEKP